MPRKSESLTGQELKP